MGHKVGKERWRSRLFRLRATIANYESMLRYNREITIYFPKWSVSTAEIKKNLKKARKEELEELKRRGFHVEE